MPTITPTLNLPQPATSSTKAAATAAHAAAAPAAAAAGRQGARRAQHDGDAEPAGDERGVCRQPSVVGVAVHVERARRAGRAAGPHDDAPSTSR